MSDTHVVILAAGQGTRMKSAAPKVLHQIAGRPLVEHVLQTAQSVAPASISLIVGHQAGAVKQRLAGWPGLHFALQDPQLGTAHALQQAEPLLAGKTGTVVLLSADVPLFSPATLGRLLEIHRGAGATATVVTARLEHPTGYGRIVRQHGRIARIVEEKDASAEERQIREINSGIYALELEPLFGALRGIASSNAQGEFYLTDLIAIYHAEGRRLETVNVDDLQEISGINSRGQLAEMSRLVRQKKNDALMAAGVTLIDPATTYVDPDVEVGADTILHPGVTLQGRTRIGSGCEIQGNVRISDSRIGDHVTINNFCLIVGADVANRAAVGPFAHLRPGTRVGEEAKVGNFVELKKTSLGAGSKVSHLSYLGDATVGSKVNVGAGTITCNYDGEHKHQTIIEDGAFIGSDSQLIAPVRVGKGAYVGAGSSITQDVPAGGLGIARSRQSNVDGWVARKKGTAAKT
jgi:bifunctional UDP-N-acetylglucosamine pyrophosphorylase/glucosamine-1-phosphate N-acetyltransferase